MLWVHLRSNQRVLRLNFRLTEAASGSMQRTLFFSSSMFRLIEGALDSMQRTPFFLSSILGLTQGASGSKTRGSSSSLFSVKSFGMTFGPIEGAPEALETSFSRLFHLGTLNA